MPSLSQVPCCAETVALPPPPSAEGGRVDRLRCAAPWGATSAASSSARRRARDRRCTARRAFLGAYSVKALLYGASRVNNASTEGTRGGGGLNRRPPGLPPPQLKVIATPPAPASAPSAQAPDPDNLKDCLDNGDPLVHQQDETNIDRSLAGRCLSLAAAPPADPCMAGDHAGAVDPAADPALEQAGDQATESSPTVRSTGPLVHP